MRQRPSHGHGHYQICEIVIVYILVIWDNVQWATLMERLLLINLNLCVKSVNSYLLPTFSSLMIELHQQSAWMLLETSVTGSKCQHPSEEDSKCPIRQDEWIKGLNHCIGCVAEWWRVWWVTENSIAHGSFQVKQQDFGLQIWQHVHWPRLFVRWFYKCEHIEWW